MTISTETHPAQTAAIDADPEFEQAIVEVLNAAIEQHGAGQLNEAEALYGIVLDAAPAHPAANYNLGMLRMQRGDSAGALPNLEAAIGAQPTEGQYWASYVMALGQSGNVAAAWTALEMAQKQGLRGPAIDALIVNLSAAEALQAEARSGAATPGKTEQVAAYISHSVQAPALVPEAPQATRKGFLAAKPPQQKINQLITVCNQSRADEALALARKMTIEFPEYFLGWKVQGLVLHMQGQTAPAIEALQAAKRFDLKELEVRRLLADCFRLQGFKEEAERECREILAIKPIYRILGMTLQDLGRLDEAIEALRKTVKLRPDFADAHGTIAVALLEAGRIDEAEQSCRQAIALKPRDSWVHEALLFCLTHKENLDPAAFFADYLYFAEMCEAPLRARWPSLYNVRDPERRLNVGFVSGDFIRHPVTAFIETVIEHLSRDPSLTIHAYSNHTVEDDVTARMRGTVSHWHAIAGMKDEDLARKPAPVQASWMGYLNTTGLKAMDYYFADRYYVEEESAASQFVEKIVYLPAFACFRPELLSAPVNALPALHNGYVTFGSFNRANKVRPATIALWSKLLRAVPTSRMQIGAMPADGKHDQIIEWFENEGIGRARLDFRSRAPLPVYLQQHH